MRRHSAQHTRVEWWRDNFDVAHLWCWCWCQHNGADVLNLMVQFVWSRYVCVVPTLVSTCESLTASVAGRRWMFTCQARGLPQRATVCWSRHHSFSLTQRTDAQRLRDASLRILGVGASLGDARGHGESTTASAGWTTPGVVTPGRIDATAVLPVFLH